MLTFSEIQQFKKQLTGNWHPDVERCGVINLEHQVLEVTNHSDTPERTFTFVIEDIEGNVATWHSHPSGSANLSIDDYRFFQSWPNQMHFIICQSEVRCYIVSNGLVHLIDEEKDYPPRPSG